MKAVAMMFDDVYVQAYRDGGLKAVNDLLKEHFPTGRDRVMVMETLKDTGYWAITWHEKKHPDEWCGSRPDFVKSPY
jgi:hypothetical protein